MKLRAEWFGGLVALDQPRLVAEVNRAMMRRLGVPSSARWGGDDPGHLSAPTEVHLVLSKRCGAGCAGCYVDATPRGPAMTVAEGKGALERLAQSGVFHVAMGGGEALDSEDVFELAEYARGLGILPNLTTSGLGMTPTLADRCKVFGQINVSVDGVGAAYEKARGFDGYGRAVRALRLLRARKREVGINCVVSRSTYDGLGELVALARRMRLHEVELLRFKPAGRGAARFAEEDLTPEQARGIYPRARWLALRHLMRVKLDCSFAPMVFWHRPSRFAARFFGVVGCEGGNLLAAVEPDGTLRGCSFGGPAEASIADEAATARAFESGFSAFRGYVDRAPEPCRSCDYLALCKGGCRVVAQHGGDWFAPDPGCPRVVQWRASHGPNAFVSLRSGGRKVTLP